MSLPKRRVEVQSLQVVARIKTWLRRKESSLFQSSNPPPLDTPEENNYAKYSAVLLVMHIEVKGILETVKASAILNCRGSINGNQQSLPSRPIYLACHLHEILEKCFSINEEAEGP